MHLLKISLILLLSLNLYAGAADGVGTDGPDTYSPEELMGVLPNVLDDFVEFMMDEASLKYHTTESLFENESIVRSPYFGRRIPVIDLESRVKSFSDNFFEECKTELHDFNDIEEADSVTFSILPSFIRFALGLEGSSSCAKQVKLTLEKNELSLEDLVIDSFLAKRSGIDNDFDWNYTNFAAAMKKGILSYGGDYLGHSEVLVEYRKQGVCPSPMGGAFLSVRLQDTKRQYAGSEGEYQTLVLCYALEKLSQLPKRDFEKMILSQFAHELTHLHYTLEESWAEKVEHRFLERWETFQVVKAKWLEASFPADCLSFGGKYLPGFDYLYYSLGSGLHSIYDNKRKCLEDVSLRNQSRLCIKNSKHTDLLENKEINEKYVIYDLWSKKALSEHEDVENCRKILFQGGEL